MKPVVKPNAKLSREQVVQIKLHLLDGVTSSALARLYGVSGETINRIRRGLTHQDVVVAGEEALRADAPLAPIAAPVPTPEPETPPTPEAGDSMKRLADILDHGLKGE